MSAVWRVILGVNIPSSTTALSNSGNQDVEGFSGGLTIGYNWQMDWGLFGVEADISYADIDGDFGDQPNWSCVDRCQTEIDWFGTARLRAGLPMGRALPFITGGAAFAHIDSEIVGNSDFALDETQVGWTAGGGLEFAINERWSVKGEYLYVDLGRATDDDSSDDFELEAEFSTVRLGVNYRF